MQDLRDKLRKAGVVSKKQARKAGLEVRREKKREGGGKPAQQLQQLEEQKQRERFEARRAQEREEARERQAELNRQAEDRAQQARIDDLICAHAVVDRPPKGQAERTFNFVGLDRRIRRIHVSYELAARLTQGHVAIVAVEAAPGTGRDWALVDQDAARKLEELDAGRLLFWNREEAGDLPTHGAGR